MQDSGVSYPGNYLNPVLSIVHMAISGIEWVVVGAAVLLLFGAKKIPDLARSLGKASGEFKKAQVDAEQSVAITKKTRKK